jgi:hypothetical protein
MHEGVIGNIKVKKNYILFICAPDRGGVAVSYIFIQSDRRVNE